ncbi:MAG: response regulator transcription factor [Chromatiales bacterium]|nr:response regulator transcription factor [Chromatiales bacterium]
MDKIKILIADDHSIVRQGLRQIVNETDDLEVFGEASDGHEAIKMVREGEWDVLLLDVSMPGLSGVDVLKRLKDQNIKLPVLVLSTYPADQYAVRLLKSGANGYLTKESAPEELVIAIRKVSKGGKYISPVVAELLSENLMDDHEEIPHKRLSDREYQVLCLLASGKTVTEIADGFSLSVKTISTYRTRILEKMHMSKTSELIHYAIKNELVE